MNTLNNNSAREILKSLDIASLTSLSKTSRKMKSLSNGEALRRVKNRNTTPKQMKDLARYFKIPPLFGPQALKRSILAKYNK